MGKMFLAFVAIALVVVAAVFTYGIDFTVKSFIVFALAVCFVSPILVAMYYYFSLLFSLYKRFAKRMAIKIANDKRLEDTVASHLYFIADMAPSVSSVSIVAIFVATEASTSKLVVMFFFGILMKYVARRMIRSFYRVIRKLQGAGNERGCDSGD